MKRNLILSLSLLLVIALGWFMFPTFLWAQDYPDVDGTYWHARTRIYLYTTDGDRMMTIRGVGVWFDEQDDSVVSGEIDVYEASTVRGSRIYGGTGVITGRNNAVSLREGLNTITVTTFGTHSIYLPPGVEATATSGTATVTGSPLALEPGTSDVPTTGNGTFTVFTSLIYTTVGEFVGVVGEGLGARFQLVGTTVYATVTSGTGTVTGSPVKALPASTTVTISAPGTFTVALPYGMHAIATSGTATLVGSPVTLTPGEDNVLDTGATTGTVVIGMQVGTAFNVSGRFYRNRFTGDVRYLKGRVDGFVVLDPGEWEVLIYNKPFRAKYVPGD